MLQEQVPLFSEEQLGRQVEQLDRVISEEQLALWTEPKLHPSLASQLTIRAWVSPIYLEELIQKVQTRSSLNQSSHSNQQPVVEIHSPQLQLQAVCLAIQTQLRRLVESRISRNLSKTLDYSATVQAQKITSFQHNRTFNLKLPLSIPLVEAYSELLKIKHLEAFSEELSQVHLCFNQWATKES